jgi:DNA modification methylase
MDGSELWTLYLGDCVEVTKRLADESMDLSVFSPPFPGMYTYSNSVRDIGNAKGIDDLMAHFAYLAPELLRVTKPGRSAFVHLTQYVAHINSDGFAGLKDFRGRTIEMMQEAGWRYYGEITIDKNPQVKAIRTKDRGLLFKTLANDSSMMHVALPDWVLHFRKDGANATPIRAGVSDKYGNPGGWVTQEEWIRWARPIWYAQDWAPNGDGISETDVLNVAVARDSADERHICPLQLPVTERIVKLWSAPGEVVFSPFAGIGSEGHEAIRLGRRFVGIELKESYWKTACRNLAGAEALLDHQSLFDSTQAPACQTSLS